MLCQKLKRISQLMRSRTQSAQKYIWIVWDRVGLSEMNGRPFAELKSRKANARNNTVFHLSPQRQIRRHKSYPNSQEFMFLTTQKWSDRRPSHVIMSTAALGTRCVWGIIVLFIAHGFVVDSNAAWRLFGFCWYNTIPEEPLTGHATVIRLQKWSDSRPWSQKISKAEPI